MLFSTEKWKIKSKRIFQKRIIISTNEVEKLIFYLQIIMKITKQIASHRPSSFSLIILLGFIVLLYSCTKISPLARSNYAKAKTYASKNKEIEAMERALAAIIEQPDYKKATKYVYKNWDMALSTTLNELEAIKTTQKPTEAARQVYLYAELIKVYDNLKKIKLPLKHPKGRWEWTTKIIDYTADYNSAVEYAYSLHLKVGKQYVAKGEFYKAKSLYQTTLARYCSDDKLSATKDIIAESYNAYGKKYENSNNVEEVIDAYNAYIFSLDFKMPQSEITAAKKAAKQRVSLLYYNMANELYKKSEIDKLLESYEIVKKSLKWNSKNEDAKLLKINIKQKLYDTYTSLAAKQEKVNTYESLPKAIDFYKKAKKWKPGDKESKESIVRVKNKLAEKYYVKARKMEKNKANTKADIVKNYKLAQKWVPKYKDSQKRIHIVGIVFEMRALEVNTTETAKQNEITRKNVSTTADKLGTAEKSLNKVTYVSNKFYDLHSSLNTVSNTCRTLGGIPVVGSVASATKTSITVARPPVDKAVTLFKKIEKPVIEPSKRVVAKSKTTVESVDNKMTSLTTTLKSINKSNRKIRKCIEDMDEPKDLKSVEKDITNINKYLVKYNTEFIRLNKSIEDIKSVAITFNSYIQPVNNIERGVKTMSGAIKVMKSATDGINKVLKQRIYNPFGDDPSVKKILETATGPIAALMDKAMSPLKPYLAKLSGNIPAIPGIDAFSANIGGLEKEYKKIEKAYKRANKSLLKLTDYESKLKTSFNSIVEKTGCGEKI